MKKISNYLVIVILTVVFGSCGGGSGGSGTSGIVDFNSLTDGSSVDSLTAVTYTAVSAIDKSSASTSNFFVMAAPASSSSISGKSVEYTTGDCSAESKLAGTLSYVGNITVKNTLDAQPSDGTYLICILELPVSVSTSMNKATATTTVSDVKSVVLNSGSGSTVPENVAVAAMGARGLSISWDAVTEADSYKIYYGTETGITKDTGTLIDATITGVSYVQGELTEGGTYYYIVTSVISDVESDASTEANGIPAFQGVLDTSFGAGEGYITQAYTQDEESDGSVPAVIDPNGYIYVLAPNGEQLFRFISSDGTLDTSYGNGNGYIDISGENQSFNCMAIDSTGSIYVGGAIEDGEDDEIAYIKKYNSDGTASDIDPFEYTARDSSIERLYIDSNDNIFAAGSSWIEPYGRPTAWKLNTSLETVAGPNGETAGIGGFGFRSMAVDSSGNIFMGCTAYPDPNPGVVKFKADISIDTDFAESGIMSLDEEGSFTGIVLDSSGNIYGSGYYGSSEEEMGALVVLKLDSAGDPVPGFGTDGILTKSDAVYDLGSPSFLTEELLMIPGTIVTEADDLSRAFAVDSAAGVFDTSIFTDGIYSLGSGSSANSLADDSGRLIIIGSQYVDEATDSIRITRFK